MCVCVCVVCVCMRARMSGVCDCACGVCLHWRSYIKLCASVAYEAVICDDVDEGQAVPHTTLVVIEVMGWSDLHSTCTAQGNQVGKQANSHTHSH